MRWRILFFLVVSSVSYVHSQTPSFTRKWDHTLGGGLNDMVTGLLALPGGNLLIHGTSYSGISGEKTEDNHDTTYQTSDFWIVCTDSAGIKLWDKRYGGLNSEIMSDAIRTSDN